jgi:translocation and assembly module TamA
MNHRGVVAAVLPQSRKDFVVLPSLVRRLVALAAVAIVAATASAVPAARAQDDGAPTPGAAPGVAYTVVISGVVENDIALLLRESSQLVALRERPPASLAGLRRRAEDDSTRLVEALRSKGFYAATVTANVDAGASPARVDVAVETGVLYLLGEFAIHYADAADRQGLVEDLEDLGLHLGVPAEGATVVAAQERLIRCLAERGRPLARVLDRRVTVDHADATMRVELRVDPGLPARLGRAEFRGTKAVEPAYLQRLVPWAEGAVFDQRMVDQLRTRLWTTDLFGTVTILPFGSPSADGTLPVIVDVTERAARTISAGANFSTDRGVGGDVSWEHRNLFGEQESLAFRAAGDFVEQSLTADFRKPNVGRYEQAALANAAAIRHDTDAYRERTVTTFVGIERKFARVWSGRVGPSLDYSVLNDNDDDNAGEETFLIGGLPASVTRDTTDNALDPTQGTRLTAGLTPSVGTLERDITFLTQELGGSAYLSVMTEDRVVLAGRFRLASLLGAETDELPASKRIYGGGGGSVRGYAFESLGPLDSENDPLGGRSAIEVGFETRVRVTDDFGLVPFVEGGNVFDAAVPRLGETLQWAAGLGARYFTRVGPLRLDLAFPINGRDGVDSFFEFYVSLGQAF